MNNLERLLRINIHNLRLYAKYKPWGGKRIEPKIVYMIDGSMHHSGLVDRITQILGVYALCKKRNYKFGLVANYPFELSEYLLPKYDWKMTKDNFSKNIFYSRPLYLGIRSKEKYEKLLVLKNRQIHAYASVHWGLIHDYGYNVKTLFHELFQFSPTLQRIAKEYKKQHTSWDAIHFRFINLLDDFNEPNSKKMSINEKRDLLNACTRYVVDRSTTTKNKILVCSDSSLFLDKVSQIPNVIITPGAPEHIDYINEKMEESVLKTFIDFILISESQSITSVVKGDMYPSNFPERAADINSVKFNRVTL